MGRRPGRAHLGGARRDARARRRRRRPSTTRSGGSASALDISRLVVVGDGRRAIADGRPARGVVGRGAAGRRRRRGATRCCVDELRPGDVVLVKSAATPATVARRPARPAAGSRRPTAGARMKAVLIAAVRLARHRAARHAALHPVPRRARATASSSATTARRRTTPSAARRRWAAPSSSARPWSAYLARAPCVTGTPPTASGAARAVPHDRARARRVPRRLHQDLQAAQPRPAVEREDGRPDARRRRRSRCSPCSSRTARASRRPRPHISFIRDTHVDLAFAGPGRADPVRHLGQLHDRGASNGVNLTDGLDGLATGASVMVFARLRHHRVLAVGNRLPDQRRDLLLRGARPASTSRSSPPRDGRVLRVPVVERLAGQDLHGRHRVARARRRLAGLAIVTRTELLLLVLGGLFVVDHALGDHPGRRRSS